MTYTTHMDFLPIHKRPTVPMAAIAISEQITFRLPATLPVARPVRPMLATWLRERCEGNGGNYYGTLADLRQESGIQFSLEDIRTLARYGYISEPLICEYPGCETYLFITWEGSHGR